MSARWLISLAALLAAPAAAQDAPSAEDLADRFEYALVAGDYRMLPVADDFTYAENGAVLEPWDGMWNTVTALEGVADPALYPGAAALDYRVEYTSGDTVIRLVESEEQSVRGVLAYRLVARDGKIASIDTLPIREEFTGERSGTVSLMQPFLSNTMDGARIGPVDPSLSAAGEVSALHIENVMGRYFARATGEQSEELMMQIAFAPGCERYDNGRQVTNMSDAPLLDPQQPDFRPHALGCKAQMESGFYGNFRVGALQLITDPAHGIGMAFVRLDQPGTVMSFEAPGVGAVNYPGPRGAMAETDTSEQFASRITDNMITPLSINGVFLFKFDGNGAVERIEAFYRAAPYKWSGWDFEE